MVPPISTSATSARLSARHPWNACTAAAPHPKQAMARKMADQGASSSPLSPVAAISALKDEAISPKLTDHECPMAVPATATTGWNPNPMSSGATTATGTPNPATPWRKALNAQARIRSCSTRSAVSRTIPDPMTSIAPAASTTRYSTRAIQMM